MTDASERRSGRQQVSVEAIRGAASDVNSGNDDRSSRTERQVSALEETAATMEEFTSSVRRNADNAAHANGLAASASDIAGQGGVVVAEAVEMMKAINSSSRQIAGRRSVGDGKWQSYINCP